jgi:hypothetical protein
MRLGSFFGAPEIRVLLPDPAQISRTLFEASGVMNPLFEARQILSALFEGP